MPTPEARARREIWQNAYDRARANGAGDDFARLVANQALERAGLGVSSLKVDDATIKRP